LPAGRPWPSSTTSEFKDHGSRNRCNRPWADAPFCINHALPRNIATVKCWPRLPRPGGWRGQVFETNAHLSLTSPVSCVASWSCSVLPWTFSWRVSVSLITVTWRIALTLSN
jgi:hypothetical protein